MLELQQDVSEEQENRGLLESVFINGDLLRDQSLADIRKLVEDSV